MVNPELASLIGLNEAIVIQQIHYWCEINKKAKKNYKNKTYWTYNSIKQWKEQFPFWSESTIKRTIKNLENKELIITGCFNKKGYDRTKWYCIDYKKLNRLQCQSKGICLPICQNDQMEDVILTQPIPKNKQRLTTVNNVHGNNGVLINQNTAHFQTEKIKYSENTKKFINTYMFDLYKQKMGKNHPHITPEQYYRVYNVLKDFCFDDYDYMIELAIDFFNNKTIVTDYNINHFATEGILEMRMYDTGNY